MKKIPINKIRLDDIPDEALLPVKTKNINEFIKLNTFTCYGYHAQISPECCWGKVKAGKETNYVCRGCLSYKVGIINVLCKRILHYTGNEITESNIYLLRETIDVNELYDRFEQLLSVNETDKGDKKKYHPLRKNIRRKRIITQDEIQDIIDTGITEPTKPLSDGGISQPKQLSENVLSKDDGVDDVLTEEDLKNIDELIKQIDSGIISTDDEETISDSTCVSTLDGAKEVVIDFNGYKITNDVMRVVITDKKLLSMLKELAEMHYRTVEHELISMIVSRYRKCKENHKCNCRGGHHG